MMLTADCPAAVISDVRGCTRDNCGSSNARACQVRKSGHVLHARQGYLAETSLGQAFDSGDRVKIVCAVLRDNLDENGCGSRSVEAAAGSEVMIVLMIELRKDFLWSPFFDCR